MAIRVITGVLGGGKSFYAVNWLVTNYCVQLKNGRYVLNPDKKVRIITNIDGLNLPHEDFQTLVDKAGGLSEFFKVDYQSALTGDYNVIYILDEAQQWFRTGFCKWLVEDNFYYFEYSRHLGHDIFLITHSEKNIIPQLVRLAEHIKKARPRTLNVANELTYKTETVDGDDLGIERIFFSKKIAALYKSMDKAEAVKIKNPLARKFFLALAISVAFLGYSGWKIYQRWGVKSKSHAAAQQTKSQSVSSSSVSGSSSLAKTYSLGSSMQQDQQQVEWYMYLLDWYAADGILYFRLGISWIPRKEFPYVLVRKGKNYFAMIPSVLVDSLDDGGRALPIRTKSETDGGKT